MSAPLRLLLATVLLLLLAAPAEAIRPLDRLPAGTQAGIFSPNDELAGQRAQAPFGLRYIYVTGGVGDGRRARPGTQRGRGVAAYLRESREQRTVPVLTYYELQPSAPSGRGGPERTASALRSRSTMRAYWRDLRDTLKIAGANRRQLVVLHIEPDEWQFIEQLQGVRTRAQVASTGLRELRGLPNDASGYARAFARLRDRYAPNVALAFHLSAFGTGQKEPGSVQNSRDIGALRAKFVRDLGVRFDLAFGDPGANQLEPAVFDRYRTLVRTFNARSRLPIMLWQLAPGEVPATLLGDDAGGRSRLAGLRRAGVRGLMFDTSGERGDPEPGRGGLFDLVAAAYRDGRLG